MSNKPKRTVKGEFGGIYGPGGVLNIGKNKTTQELSNNIPESNLNLNEIIENNIERSRSRISRNKMDEKRKSDTDIIDLKSSDSDTENTKNLDIKEILKIPNSIQSNSVSSISSMSSPFKIIYVLIILAILIIVTLFFFYKDKIMTFFNNFKSNKDTKDATKDMEDKTKPDKVETSKIDNIEKKVNNLETKSHTHDPHDPAVKTLNNKLNNISPYKEANVTSDGFCYIGYDDGQRECVDVYQGDVCMSGEIFPSLDICINPKLRP